MSGRSSGARPPSALADTKICAALGAMLITAAAAGCGGSARSVSAVKTTASSATSRPATPATAVPPARPVGPVNVYAHTGPGMVNPRWRGDPERVYVPNSLSNTVTVINPRTYKVIGWFPVGAEPNHVTPSWSGSVLWVNNTEGYSLTRINPKTGKPGASVPVADPYNLSAPRGAL